MQEQTPDERDRELMEALGMLKLPPPGVSQRDIWYRAGVGAGERRAKAWKGLAAIVTVAAAVALALDHRPAQTPQVAYVKHVEHSPTNVAPVATSSSASLAYERMRDRLVEDGLGGLPPIDFSGDGGQSPPAGQEHSREFEDGPQTFWYR
jgi:hypothetical protein